MRSGFVLGVPPAEGEDRPRPGRLGEVEAPTAQRSTYPCSRPLSCGDRHLNFYEIRVNLRCSTGIHHPV